ncbi:PhoU domain-containing protein [Natronoarchaeum sp. GCM10025703]|uniref:PhoU domain-containing protein n=1 Tax=unclassified Natronoarchaeum TaxID=2620183 RepID=UPI0036241AB0
METRKVQITGGSTYTVSLPKSWATENDVAAGSEVEFYVENDSLLLMPKTDEEHTEGTLDVTDLEGDQLTRAVMTMYVSGFDMIALEGNEITSEQRRAIRSATQSLIGVEVLEETGERVVLQDLLDSSELSITNAVTRMRLIAESMLADAVTALVENDDNLARDVIQRDDDVDRLWFVVSRTFRATLRNTSAATELGLPREDCFDYHSSARQLERSADHAAKISKLTLQLDDIPEDVTDEIVDLHEEAAGIIDQAMDALLTDDSSRSSEIAHQVRESILELDERSRRIDDELRTLDPHEAQLLGIIVDSLSRSADYGGNIAETALQKAAPRP